MNSENILDNFIKEDLNENYILMENFKVVKLTQNTFIYQSHIRNESNDIYINSVTVESVNHTKDYIYIPHCQGNYELLNNMYHNIHNTIKKDLYLTSSLYCMDFDKLIHTTFNNSITINKTVFFCPHNCKAFAHTISYFYSIICIYYILTKYIPDILLIITYESEYTKFLLDTLNIKNYMVINTEDRIINEGTTYFAGELSINMSENMINLFFYDIIVKNTLRNPINADFPKKILFLRNSSNIVSPGLLSNREEIVNIANKYEYVDIDQTKLSLHETIHLINNATHIILEAGGALLHLLWSKNIKSIILNYKPVYWDTYAYLCEHANEILKLTSNNLFVDIIKSKKTKVIYNDYDYIKTGIISDNCYTFTNIIDFQNAIEENDN